MSSRALFDLDTNTADNSLDIKDMADGITVTLSGGSGPELSPVGPVGGKAPNLTSADLNCIDAISFTVRAPATGFGDLPESPFQGLSHEDERPQKTLVCPDEVAYMVHIKDVPGSKLIRVYDSSGEKVLQGKDKSGDADHLRKGLYFFKYLRACRVQELKKI